MSWGASGYVENGVFDKLQYDPAYEDLDPLQTQQAEYLITFIEEAFNQGVLIGGYHVTFGDNYTPDNPADRKALYFSAMPANSPTNQGAQQVSEPVEEPTPPDNGEEEQGTETGVDVTTPDEDTE